MRGIEINTKTKLITEECFNCGVLFAMPERFREHRLRNGDAFYCPAGHGQVYTESTEKQLRETKERLMKEKLYSGRLHQQLDGTLSKLNDKAKEMRRLKRRVKAGVCTECHRHFENLQRHMESKHE